MPGYTLLRFRPRQRAICALCDPFFRRSAVAKFRGSGVPPYWCSAVSAGSANESEFDLSPDLHHATRRNVEETRRSPRISREPSEQALTPDCHPRPLRRQQRLSTHKERRLARVDLEPHGFATSKNRRHLRILREAVTSRDAVHVRFD